MRNKIGCIECSRNGQADMMNDRTKEAKEKDRY